mmetsp:Transcript_7162/g.17807  ORF Transcript_7162/g.17807 Transcript_7162/m.17807 type:complete len:271 (+) Transcript_7162:528-1340(+)
MQPDRRKHVKHLHKHGAKRQHPAHHHIKRPVDKPRGHRNLPRDLVCAHGVLHGLLPKPEIRAEEDQGRGDAQPHAEEREQGAERYGARRLLPPDEEVQDEEDGEADTGEKHGGPQAVALPAVALEHPEQARRRVPAKHAHEHKQEESGLHQRPPVGGREEAETREHHQDERRHGKLHARAREYREPPGHGGRPEHVAVHELPASLLLTLLKEVLLLVALEVPPESAHHDHGDEARQEEDDHEGVEDREPVHLRVVSRLQVRIPARRPLHR